MSEITNLPASIHQQLLNKAKTQARPFNDLFQYYAIERFLYRLSASRFSNSFILKGALAILLLDYRFPRVTKDIDLLGSIENSIPVLVNAFKEVCQLPVPQDGLFFDPASISAKIIKPRDEHPGLRIKLIAHLGNALSTLQLDIGFSDATYPPPMIKQFPVILSSPPPSVQVYAIETVIAEKVHALFKHGSINSRLKDIYDIRFIAGTQKIEGIILSEAIRSTFTWRATSVPNTLIIFDEGYITIPRQKQWDALVRKIGLENEKPEFTVVLNELGAFLNPVLDSISKDTKFALKWDASLGWKWI